MNMRRATFFFYGEMTWHCLAIAICTATIKFIIQIHWTTKVIYCQKRTNCVVAAVAVWKQC